MVDHRRRHREANEPETRRLTTISLNNEKAEMVVRAIDAARQHHNT